jgi:spore maturation protein CgeB
MDSLKPFVHYIPIKKDFSDLFEKIEYLKNNDKEAERIAKNAQEFAREHFKLGVFRKKLRECFDK